jgi:hypothetical protein
MIQSGTYLFRNFTFDVYIRFEQELCKIWSQPNPFYIHIKVSIKPIQKSYRRVLNNLVTFRIRIFFLYFLTQLLHGSFPQTFQNVHSELIIKNFDSSHYIQSFISLLFRLENCRRQFLNSCWWEIQGFKVCTVENILDYFYQLWAFVRH